jgi:DtxR family transcriptional regulator, Mn-dependent transcriptional regulator
MAFELTETMENYLEAIYTIIMKKNGVRVKDIAQVTGVKSSSVTIALRSLEKNGFIDYEPYGIISLTRKGNIHARQLTERHRYIKSFFMNILAVDARKAGDVACGMEHVLDQELFHRFVKFLKFTYKSHNDDPAWIEEFKKFMAENEIELESDGTISPRYLEDFQL